MPDSVSRRAVLLDWVAVAGLIGPALVLLDSVITRATAMTWMLAGALGLSAVTWVVWRRMPQMRRVAAVLFAFAAVAVITFGDSPLTIGAAGVATLVLARTFHTFVTVAYAVLLCLLTATIHLLLGNGLTAALVESLATMGLVSFGAAFALLMKDADRVDAERVRLSEAQNETLVQLSEANAELERRLGSEQDLVLAEERARIAHELHDELGHRLTAVGLSLDYAMRMRDRDAGRADAELLHARDTVSEAFGVMRTIVRAMHPVELGSLRGAEAFLAVADAFRSTGLDVRVDVADVEELSHEHSLLILRFVQEGLTNAVRHAGAADVDLRIGGEEGGVRATLEDTGGAAGEAFVEGFGLRSLRTRASAAGGVFSAQATSRGFRVEMILPSAVRAVA